MVLAHDAIVMDWAAVPDQLRAFLERKREKGAERTLPANPVDALDPRSHRNHVVTDAP